MKNNFGVTLVESLVIIGILSILTAITIPAFQVFRRGEDLNEATEKIINILRLTQNKTLASEGASQWGVYFTTSTSPHQYVLFKGSDYDSRATSSDEVYKLSKGIEIYEINLSGGNEVVFDRVGGTTSQFGSLSLRLKAEPQKTKTIYIENSGQVKLTSPSTPSDENRIKDSRHVHFDLGWSIQDATTLKFYFPNIPQTETIDMAVYFNAEKTEFDWDGTFSVGGADQVFRVHTHSLSVSNLCIHRDRNEGKNTEEVIIYIIDGGIEKDIAHYLADANDTVIEGIFGGTKEVQ